MKRFFRIAIVLCMLILVICPAYSVSVAQTYIDVWDGSIASDFSEGSGTSSDPYLIKTGSQLAFLAQQVNSGNSYIGVYFALANDIDLANRVWMPIGGNDDTTPFCGKFNGNYHAIKQLRLTSIDKKYGGLFGRIQNATVEKLFLINTNIDGDGWSVGAVAGRAWNSTISQCCHTGRISGDQSVGGIIGTSSYSTITDCYNAGIISSRWSSGGIVGQANLQSKVINSYNSGSVKSNRNCGGIAGFIMGDNYGSQESSITACFNSGNVYGATSIGTITGYCSIYGSISKCYFSPSSYYGIGGIGNNLSGSNSGTTLTDRKNLFSQQWISEKLGWNFNSIWVMPIDGYYQLPILGGDNPMKNLKVDMKDALVAKNGCYYITVTDSNGTLIPNPIIEYNGIVFPVTNEGYASLVNAASGGNLTISAKDFATLEIESYKFKASNSDIIKLVHSYELTSAVMTYNKDKRDIISERAVINLINKDTKFTIECTVSSSEASSIKKFNLMQDNNVIASSKDGKFTVKVGDFEKDVSVSVTTLDANNKQLSSTPLMLTIKKSKVNVPSSMKLGKSIKFTVPSDALIFGGTEFEFSIPVLPITMETSEDSVEVGINFNIAEYKNNLSAGGKDPKIKWLKGITRPESMAEQIDEIVKEIGSKKMKHRLSRGFSVEWSVFGAGEIPFDSNSILKGKLYVLVEFKAQAERQVCVVPPIVLQFSINAEASVGGEFEWTIENDFAFQLPFTFDTALGLYGGLGGASFASVGVYGNGGTEIKVLLAGNEANSGLESWKIYGSAGIKAMLLRKEILKMQLWNGEYYLYRRDTGGLKSMPAQPYMSPGRAFSELDSDLVYTTVARQQQSRWIGAAAPDVETIVVQPELSYIAEPVEATDTPAPTPETTPVEADMATQDPEPTPNPEPESTPVPDESSAPVQETEPLPVPSPSPTPTPELTSDIEQTPESTHDANEQLMAIGDMYTSRLSAHNIPSTSSNTMFAPQALLNLPSSPEALQVNSDTEIDPILVDCGDTLMMLYCDADATRPIEDCSKLVFSLLDTVTGQWTEPIAVWDDGTADYAPDAYATENGVYIVWQNAKTSINENDTLNEIGAKLEVSVAHFDIATRTFTVETITDNDCYEAMPNICLTADGMPVLTWAENAENDVLGLSATEQKPNRIYYMQKDESGWNEKLLLAEYDSIALSMDTGLTTNGVEVCVNLDTDNNLDTTTDRIILFAQPYKSTSYISGTGARYLDGVPLYLDNTTEDATALYYNGAAMNTTFLPDTDYTAAVNADGNITLCWSITQDGKSNLYAMTYGAAESIWTEPIALTEADANHYHEKVACAYAAGKPIFVYVDQSISDTSAMDATAGLYWFAMPERESYTINSVIYDETAVKPGCALPLTIEITNTGTVSIDKLHATLIDANGEIALEQDVPLALLSGCTGDAELMLSLPEEAQHMQYTLKLGNEEYSDIDIGRAMLITGNQVYKTDDEQTVIAYVKNIGLDTASGTFTVIDQENGAVVTSGNFSDLGYNDVFYLQFSISGMQTDWDLMLVAETDTLQTSTGGNTSYIKLYHENTFVLGDINQDGNVNILDLILLAKHIVGIKTLPSNQILLADINKDGILDLKDALMLCHYIAS